MPTGFWCGNVRKETISKTETHIECNNKMDLTERGWEGVDWIYLL